MLVILMLHRYIFNIRPNGKMEKKLPTLEMVYSHRMDGPLQHF